MITWKYHKSWMTICQPIMKKPQSWMRQNIKMTGVSVSSTGLIHGGIKLGGGGRQSDCWNAKGVGTGELTNLDNSQCTILRSRILKPSPGCYHTPLHLSCNTGVLWLCYVHIHPLDSCIPPHKAYEVYLRQVWFKGAMWCKMRWMCDSLCARVDSFCWNEKDNMINTLSP